MEAGVSRGSSDRLGDRVVVADEVRLVDADVGANGLVGQVEHFEHDIHPADSASELERIDPFVDEVSKQFGPSRLLLA